METDVVEHTFNKRTWEAQTGLSVSQRPDGSAYQVLEHLALHRERLCVTTLNEK